MKHAAKWILAHRKTILLFALALCIFSVYGYTKMEVSNDMSDFLPEDSASTVALDTMEAEYDGSSIANVDIMVEDVTLLEALDIKAQLLEVDGLQNVTFLDDSYDLSQPLDYVGQDEVESWYKDHCARFTAYIDTSADGAADLVGEIRGLVGENGWVGGDGVASIEEDATRTSDILSVFRIAIPLILVVLLLTTNSWFEPILFFIAIGIAILINQGTNFFLGTISNITATCSMILQLAVSMDYAIFLLDAYNEYMEAGMTSNDAMGQAIVDAFSSITSSAVTTIFGFLALTVMQFRLGFDLGMVLAKGVLISLICTLTVLPVLASYCSKIIEKTKHRDLVPSLKGLGKVVSRICIPVMLIVAVIAVPAYMSQSRIDYLYGEAVENEDDGELTEAEIADARIAEVFGEETSDNMLVMMVPRGSMGTEKEMYEKLKALDHVTSVTAYLTVADESIPPEYVGEDAVSQLISENYSRILIQTDVKAESDEAFALVEEIRALGEEYFPGEALLAGNSATYYDLRETIQYDDTLVNWLSIGAIALTIMIAFKSLILPVILVGAIEAAIWINLSRFYFSGSQLMYMCRLIINAVQLGATVDYAILTANHYVANRRKGYKKFESAANTFSETALSVLTSASILCIAGLLLGEQASDAYVAQVGSLVGVGAVISGVCVLFALPALLIIFDPLIQRLSIGMRFGKKKKKKDAPPITQDDVIQDIPKPEAIPEPVPPEPIAEEAIPEPVPPEPIAEAPSGAQPDRINPAAITITVRPEDLNGILDALEKRGGSYNLVISSDKKDGE